MAQMPIAGNRANNGCIVSLFEQQRKLNLGVAEQIRIGLSFYSCLTS
jgi:hypothetical protein